VWVCGLAAIKPGYQIDSGVDSVTAGIDGVASRVSDINVIVIH